MVRNGRSATAVTCAIARGWMMRGWMKTLRGHSSRPSALDSGNTWSDDSSDKLYLDRSDESANKVRRSHGLAIWLGASNASKILRKVCPSYSQGRGLVWSGGSSMYRIGRNMPSGVRGHYREGATGGERSAKTVAQRTREDEERKKIDEPSFENEVGDMARRTWCVIKGVWTETRGGLGSLRGKASNDEDQGTQKTVNKEIAKATVARVLHLATPEKRIIAMAVASMCITTPMTLIMPAAVGKLLDVCVSANSVMSPLTVASMLLVVFSVQGVFMSARDALLSIAGERIAARLRARTFAAMMRQDMAFFDASRTGELVSRLYSDVAVVQKAITSNITSALRAAGMALGSTAMMFYTCPKLALVSLLVLPMGGALAVFIGRFIKHKQREVQDTLAQSAQQAEECLANIRLVRAFGREATEVRGYEKVVLETRELSTSIGIASSLLGSVIHVAANASLAGVLGYGGTLVVAGDLSVGMLTSFLLYSVYLAFNFGALSTVYADLMKAVGAAERMLSLMDQTTTSTPMRVGGLKLGSFQGRLDFKHVSFTYPQRPDVPILSDVSLSVAPGQVLGLVGTSGSGKSTLGSLLSRLYSPSHGSIEADGVDLALLDASWLRTVVTVVQQEPALFGCSIADNIRFGKEDADDAEVEAAAKLANAHDFISAFPNGYGTLVGERGIQLSGGQKQRVAIARAIIGNPKVLVMDEATSALDSESEFLVQQALDRVSNGRTVIKIAHRLNTIVHADIVAVLHLGQVMEVGNPQQLLANKDSFFYKLFYNQTDARPAPRVCTLA